ncbi:uncharacterized protein LOC116409731 [Xenopus tropicalis]|uniref:Uncharacterized protein LOC116409731 n=1 Tax=Xenopus tropicalis TaxID=8364 RepID=A0A8J1JDL1_XENTR|nr:uncharacterized protein LOC116409731 [Xenopus tropicalis]
MPGENPQNPTETVEISVNRTDDEESTGKETTDYEEDIGGAFEIQGFATTTVPAVTKEALSETKDIQREATTEVSAVISQSTPGENESPTTKVSDVTSTVMPGENPQNPTETVEISVNRTDDEEFAHKFYLILKPIRKAAVVIFLVSASIFALLVVYCIVLLCKLRKTGKDELRMAEEGESPRENITLKETHLAHADYKEENQDGSTHWLQSCFTACTTTLLSFLMKK